MNEAKRAGVSKESQYPFGKGLFEIKTGIGRKKNVIRRFAGKLIVRANVIFYMKTVAKIQNSEEKRK